MDLKNILFKKENHIGIITINRPPANTWNYEAMLDLETVLDEVEKDKDLRVIILTGAGEKCFSAGYDVNDHVNGHKTGPKGWELWTRVDKIEKPVIAAINGHALGGGLELALCCHFRIMADSPKSFIGLTELNLGIIPGWGGTQRLLRQVGQAKALDMILFSKRLSAAQALEIGLVNQICMPEKLMDETLVFAEKLAKRPPIAVSCVLKAMTAGIYQGFEKGLDVEAQGSAVVRESKDVIEGFTAFLEKRDPVFQGE
jgi:enoyl-CoA hydratase/carnithine racemase